MKVIGAGLPRTATQTQRLVLQTLGFDPCYHMINVFADLPTQAPLWRDVLDGRLRASEVLKDFTSMVDWPGSYHYKQLVEDFPDAKVLLSVRDGDAWAKSMRDTIWPTLWGDSLLFHMSEARRRIDPHWDLCMGTLQEMWTVSGILDGNDTTDAGMAEACRRHEAEVRAFVPADRLLAWSPKDGWEPLCDFFEVPVPEGDVPRVNDTAAYGNGIINGALAAVGAYQQAAAEPVPA